MKAAARVDLLQRMKNEGRALGDAVSMGRRVGEAKHTGGEDIDWNVVDTIMSSKLADAQKELLKLRRRRRQVTEEVNRLGHASSYRRALQRAKNKAKKFGRGAPSRPIS